MIWWWNTVITHLSCIFAKYFLWCEALWCEVLKYFNTKYFLWCEVFFCEKLHTFNFWSGCHPLSSGHVPRGVCACICMCFCTQVNFYDHTRDCISNCMHDHTNDLFGRTRVQIPGLAHDLFFGSRVWTPTLALQSFWGSRVWFPDRIACFRSVVSVAYVTTRHVLSNISSPPTCSRKMDWPNAPTTVFLHLHYHTQDPTQHIIQYLWNSTMLNLPTTPHYMT